MTLGRRLLEAAAEVLRLEWGAIYLAESPGGASRLAACHGPEPDEQALAADNPLVDRLRADAGRSGSRTPMAPDGRVRPARPTP